MAIYTISIFLLWSAVAVGQNAPAHPESKADEKNPNPYGLALGTKGRMIGGIEVLNDTQGTDFDPYLKPLLERVRKNWHRLIPDDAQTKKGKLAIEFAITKDGRLADMMLIATSGDVALDRAAWAGITKSNPFPPLPSEFNGSYLALRMRFYYNPDKSER